MNIDFMNQPLTDENLLLVISFAISAISTAITIFSEMDLSSEIQIENLDQINPIVTYPLILEIDMNLREVNEFVNIINNLLGRTYTFCKFHYIETHDLPEIQVVFGDLWEMRPLLEELSESLEDLQCTLPQDVAPSPVTIMLLNRIMEGINRSCETLPQILNWFQNIENT